MSVQLGRAVGTDWGGVLLRSRRPSNRSLNLDRRSRGTRRNPSRIRGRIHIGVV